ncbi:MAG: sulfite exporter TauE/SafE family protein [Paracoccaceae bacterium]
MPGLTELLPMILLLTVIGAFSGVISGLLGVGGGIVLVPAFFYAFSTLGYGGDRLMQVCIATSLATITVTSLRSVGAHHRKGAVDWGILRAWSPPIFAGAVLGLFTVAQLHTTALQAIFGTLALAVAAWLGLGRADWRLGSAMPAGAPRLATGGVLGFLSVLMGIGGGSFGVPLMALFGVPIHRAVATASGFGLAIAVPSAIGLLFLPVTGAPPFTVGAVNIPAFLLIVALTFHTTLWGVKLAHATNPVPLRRIFAAFLAVVALNMLRKALGW